MAKYKQRSLGSTAVEGIILGSLQDFYDSESHLKIFTSACTFLIHEKGSCPGTYKMLGSVSIQVMASNTH